jgi:hypothetical protein
VNVTGPREPDDAISVFDPATVPSVQLPTVATPSAPVVTLPPVNTPPPDVTANVTFAPSTAIPELDVTFTLGRVTTAIPAVPVNIVGETAAIAAGVLSPVVPGELHEICARHAAAANLTAHCHRPRWMMRSCIAVPSLMAPRCGEACCRSWCTFG